MFALQTEDLTCLYKCSITHICHSIVSCKTFRGIKLRQCHVELIKDLAWLQFQFTLVSIPDSIYQNKTQNPSTVHMSTGYYMQQPFDSTQSYLFCTALMCSMMVYSREKTAFTEKKTHGVKTFLTTVV